MKTVFVPIVVIVIPALVAAQGTTPPVPTNQQAAPALNALNSCHHNNTIKVPGDYPTIQQAIDASQDGDTVVVDPGTYVEKIMFWGKNITVKSKNDPKHTIIDGNSSGSVVAVMDGETTAEIAGFSPLWISKAIRVSFRGMGRGILSAHLPTPRSWTWERMNTVY